MPKKSSAKKPMVKQTQKQEQKQNINIRIGDIKPLRKKYKRRAKKATPEPIPMRQLSPVVYQTLPQLTYYGRPSESGELRGGSVEGTIATKEKAPSSIVDGIPAKKTILEDTGIVGTEGKGVEIIDVPTKKESLAELITPIKTTRKQVPKQPKQSTESISSLFREEKPSAIVEPAAAMQEFPETFYEPFVAPTETKPISKRRTKKEMAELRGMGMIPAKKERKPKATKPLPESEATFGLSPEQLSVFL